MNLTKEQKKERSQSLASEIKQSAGIFFTAYQGLKFKELAGLRESLSNAKCKFRIERNSILTHALKTAGIEGVDENLLKGPTAVAILKEDGIEELEPVITSKNTYVAPFVNAEECEYLVIEDSFPNGRPSLEKGGILFAKREVVDQVEKMKVCTCLNPLHSALAIYGCLLGYELISEEMKDDELRTLITLPQLG